jgi:general secretion pathway protein A
VLLIDEAQNLPADALEQVRLLTNLETDTQKLLQILLLGQPELRDKLARPELRQLAQRITARFHLTPLDLRETAAYLRHRWRVAGGQKFPFEPRAVQRMHRRSGGVPRLLNVVAERALLAGYARDATAIDARLVDLAADEVLPPGPRRAWWPWALAGLAVALVALGATQWHATRTPLAGTPAAASAQPPPPAPPVAALARPAAPPAPLDATALDALLAATGGNPLPAWQYLLARWQLPAARITVDPAGPCTPATPGDVHCVQGRSDRLDPLLALDRPLLLHLRAPGASDGNGSWAVLLGVDARTARLHLGGRTVDLDRVLVQSRWDGRYAGLWQGPPALSPPPRPGASGPAVDWVRQRVSRADGVTPGAPYDAALRADVATLQAARGLPADGIAGPLTLMALAGDLPGPRLLRVLE